MITAPAPLLTERDYATLIGLARQVDLHTANYRQELCDKLRRAVVISLDRVGPDLATLGSLVRYRVDGGRPMEHILALHPRQGQEHHALSVRTLRGLTLIGMQEGHTLMNKLQCGGHEVVEIEMIMFQPEADGDLMRRDTRLGDHPDEGKRPI